MQMRSPWSRARRGAQRDLPRGRRRGDGVHPGRPLLRGPGQAAVRCRAARPAGAGRQRRRGAARRHASGASPSRRSRSATSSWSGRARRSPPTASSSRHVGRRRVLLTGEPVPVEVRPGDAVAGATVNAGGRLVVRATRVGARHPLAQMAGWSRRRRAARPRSSGSPTGCPPCSCPSSSCWRWPRSPSGSATGAARSGVHRGRRRPDHRLPVRAGPGDADRAAGRHRPRRQLGILIKGPEVLESTRRVDTVVLDKTGTVTTGR